jgi:hypothetical protein
MTGGVLVLVLGKLEAYHRGPCGCGSASCWVLVADDGEAALPEIHCPERAT